MLSEWPLGCLAGALLAGGFLGGTLTRAVEVLVSFPPLFLTWAKLHSFNHSLPVPFLSELFIYKENESHSDTSISVGAPWP